MTWGPRCAGPWDEEERLKEEQRRQQAELDQIALAEEEAGGSLITSTRPTFNRRTHSAQLHEH
jgi:hypothetical protein